jgi:hypothetical protein
VLACAIGISRLDENVLPASTSIFQSFVHAGFECSTHNLRNGRRLDLLQSTQHDRFAFQDYVALQRFGIGTVRVGARWHLIEHSPGEYNFDSLAVILDPAVRSDTQIVLDLLHFGWPDHIAVFSPAFPHRFGQFVLELTRFLKRHGSNCRMFAPVNEISFLSWAGGEKGLLNPYSTTRAAELKRVLVKTAAVASEILLNELEEVRLISPEPVIHIVGNPSVQGDEADAERYRIAQFEAWDMLAGRVAPELGGRSEYLDILGVNFYDRNEWVHNSETFLRRTDPRYRPFHRILEEVWHRYSRPIFVAETGAENGARAEWFSYICDEVALAHQAGIPVHGICLYPILNHPGWEDDRHCCNGLLDYADAAGNREVYRPLAEAILNQQQRLRSTFTHVPEQHRRHLFVPSTLGFRLSAASALDEPVRAQSKSVFF